MARSPKKVKAPKPSTALKIKVKFLEDCKAGDGLVFKKGSVKELSGPSAMRWIKRGMAERHSEPPKKKAGRPKKEKPKEKEVVVVEEEEKKNDISAVYRKWI